MISSDHLIIIHNLETFFVQLDDEVGLSRWCRADASILRLQQWFTLQTGSALIFTGWDCSTLIWHNVVEFVCQGLDQSHMRLMRVVMRRVLLVWLRADDISSLAGRHPSLPWPQCWGLVGNILWSQAQLLQPVSACTDHQRFYLRTGQAIHHPATTGVTTAAIIIVSHLTATQV